MPQIKFTDTNLRTLSADKTTWFSDPTCKGLRLCVTPGGVKTWYAVKWDPASQKTRQTKLAQWAPKGTHCAWAKDQVGLVVRDIKEGKVRTKAETVVEQAGIPTLRDAFEAEMHKRRNRAAAFGGPITDETEKGYRSSFQKLERFHDLKVTDIAVQDVNALLDALAIAHPFAAHKVNVVLSMTYARAERLINKALLRPKLEKNPQMGQMDVDYDLPWADRWAEIEQVENEHKRLAWMVKWHTGMRGRMVRGLLWSDIDMHAGTMLVSTGLKKVKGKRLIAMSARVHDMFRRLHEIKMDDCDWVFPSRRIVGDARGPLDALDRLELTTEGTLRHLWNVASQDVETREMVLRWLCGHALTDGDTKNLGLYGMVPVERQRKVANLISTIIDHKCRVSPANVVEIGRTGT